MTMTASTVVELDTALNEMLIEARFLEAFDKFYHPDVVMQENMSPPTAGKAANLAREQDFYGNVEEVEESSLVHGAVSGDTTFSEWLVRLRFKDGTVFELAQVATRKWKEGLVINERFFYDAS